MRALGGIKTRHFENSYFIHKASKTYILGCAEILFQSLRQLPGGEKMFRSSINNYAQILRRTIIGVFTVGWIFNRKDWVWSDWRCFNLNHPQSVGWP